MHNVRLKWVEHVAPQLLGNARKFPKDADPATNELKEALRASEEVVGRLLVESQAVGEVKHWKGSPATFLAYLVAHEAHHRGLVMAALRLSGHKMSPGVIYGLWEWGKGG